MNNPLSIRYQKENTQFIKWAIDKLRNDPEFYFEITGVIGREVTRYYRMTDKSIVLSALNTKLKKGAREHKKIQRDFEKIAKEIEQERLDLLGWSLMRLWQLEGEV